MFTCFLWSFCWKWCWVRISTNANTGFIRLLQRWKPQVIKHYLEDISRTKRDSFQHKKKSILSNWMKLPSWSSFFSERETFFNSCGENVETTKPISSSQTVFRVRASVVGFEDSTGTGQETTFRWSRKWPRGDVVIVGECSSVRIWLISSCSGRSCQGPVSRNLDENPSVCPSEPWDVSAD